MKMKRRRFYASSLTWTQPYYGAVHLAFSHLIFLRAEDPDQVFLPARTEYYAFPHWVIMPNKMARGLFDFFPALCTAGQLISSSLIGSMFMHFWMIHHIRLCEVPPLEVVKSIEFIVSEYMASYVGTISFCSGFNHSHHRSGEKTGRIVLPHILKAPSSAEDVLTCAISVILLRKDSVRGSRKNPGWRKRVRRGKPKYPRKR